jgi:UDP-N-acetylglucosamine--N-acetylmuramyl-(pentapeptide) pyrophosphoryl-undecaprenol N-acetylglucosamine transferase
LNNGWKENLEKLKEKGYQLIWQTGKLIIGNFIQHPTSSIHPNQRIHF